VRARDLHRLTVALAVLAACGGEPDIVARLEVRTLVRDGVEVSDGAPVAGWPSTAFRPHPVFPRTRNRNRNARITCGLLKSPVAR